MASAVYRPRTTVGTPFGASDLGEFELAADVREPSWCRHCHAVYRDGHWQWQERPAAAEPSLCPACRRVRDGTPAGYVMLEGPFFERHRHELMRVLLDRAEAAHEREPLERLVSIRGDDGSVLVTTTDVGLARALGEAVHGAYGGELELDYNAAHSLLRVRWKR